MQCFFRAGAGPLDTRTIPAGNDGFIFPTLAVCRNALTFTGSHSGSCTKSGPVGGQVTGGQHLPAIGGRSVRAGLTAVRGPPRKAQTQTKPGATRVLSRPPERDARCADTAVSSARSYRSGLDLSRPLANACATIGKRLQTHGRIKMPGFAFARQLPPTTIGKRL